MAADTICSVSGAQENSLSWLPLFSHLFAMKWWDQMLWSSFFECWVLSQHFHSLFHFPLTSWQSLTSPQSIFRCVTWWRREKGSGPHPGSSGQWKTRHILYTPRTQRPLQSHFTAFGWSTGSRKILKEAMGPSDPKEWHSPCAQVPRFYPQTKFSWKKLSALQLNEGGF